LISGLEASLNGWESHPGISQAESASTSLSGVDTTVPISIPAATLPSTGGQSLDMAIMLLALFGLIFIGTGTTIAYAYSKPKA
jgi:hypothetical protein